MMTRATLHTLFGTCVSLCIAQTGSFQGVEHVKTKAQPEG